MRIFKNFALKAFAILIHRFSLLGNGKFMSYMTEYIKPICSIKVDNVELVFHTPNYVTYWRAESLFTKEAETIEWINSFKEGEIFYDIGANVGTYSIYASKKIKNLKVYAFEPTFFNYYLLNKNIFSNNLAKQVTGICAALSDKNTFDYIHMPGIVDGSAMVNFGSNLDLNKNEFKAEYTQGSLAFTLDYFIENYKLDFPDHIKIDVDGLEHEIILGSKNILKNPKLKSILIELNDLLEADVNVREIILSNGFVLKEKKHGEMFNNSTSQFSHLYNYIFVRPS